MLNQVSSVGVVANCLNTYPLSRLASLHVRFLVGTSMTARIQRLT